MQISVSKNNNVISNENGLEVNRQVVVWFVLLWSHEFHDHKSESKYTMKELFKNEYPKV